MGYAERIIDIVMQARPYDEPRGLKSDVTTFG
jgi:hypothetical protein